jgi:hypothetical protein
MAERQDPSFERFCEMIREKSGFSQSKLITPDTQFERDLGITGDDGSELLETIERNYHIQFTRESFGLAANEYLFHGEGFDLFGTLIRTLRRKPEPEFRSFTVGELSTALLNELKKPGGVESE